MNIRYDDALIAADRVVMFRSLVKQLAAAHGYQATFMAKPFFEDSQATAFTPTTPFGRAGSNVLSAMTAN